MKQNALLPAHLDQQIREVFVVDFHVGDSDEKLFLLPLGRGADVVEDVVDGSGDDARIRGVAQHCVRLAGGGLAVREDGCVEAADHLVDGGPNQLFIELRIVLLGCDDIVEGPFAVSLGGIPDLGELPLPFPVVNRLLLTLEELSNPYADTDGLCRHD